MIRAYKLMWRYRLHRFGRWSHHWKMFKRMNKYPINPLKMGRMRGRTDMGLYLAFVGIDEAHEHDGYNVVYTSIDDLHKKEEAED